MSDSIDHSIEVRILVEVVPYKSELAPLLTPNLLEEGNQSLVNAVNDCLYTVAWEPTAIKKAIWVTTGLLIAGAGFHVKEHGEPLVEDGVVTFTLGVQLEVAFNKDQASNLPVDVADKLASSWKTLMHNVFGDSLTEDALEDGRINYENSSPAFRLLEAAEGGLGIVIEGVNMSYEIVPSPSPANSPSP